MRFERSVAICILAALMAASGTAAASGFALIEQSASGLGNAYAGGAASAEDASTVFFNPAGMSRLPGKQVVIAVNAIQPSVKFSGTGTAAATPAGNLGGDAGSLAFVPNGYFTVELNPRTHIGVGVNAPFGLQTKYDAGWVGRFLAINSKIETINVNPSISYQVNDALSLGVGINFQHIHGELTSFAGGAGTASVTGNDSAWGYNLGALYEINPQTRIGVSYRSSISYNLSGGVTFSAVPALNGPVSLAIKTPDLFSLSFFHKLDDKWDVMADASLTGWSVFQQLTVMRLTALPPIPSVKENWKDTWRVSVGANHHYNEQWTARVGVAFDQTPTSDAFRTPRIPDGDRTWLALGGQYKPTKQGAVDFGYAHLFVNSVSVNQAQPGGNLVGTYNNSVDIVSVQYTHNF